LGGQAAQLFILRHGAADVVGGMRLASHLAFRAAFDPCVLAAFCFLGTDIHSETLGKKESIPTLSNEPKLNYDDIQQEGSVSTFFCYMYTV